MRVYIDGYRSHNKALFNALNEAAWYYGLVLLGGRMARHIEVEIKLTKDLKKKEDAYGYCHIISDNLNKPREFCIELDASTKFDFAQILTWLGHEFVHLKQFVRGELFDYEYGKTQWKSRKYDTFAMKHDNQPWEREAYRLEGVLYDEFSSWYGGKELL